MATTFTTAKSTSKALMTIASAFEVAMDTTHTQNDMRYYAKEVEEMGEEMRRSGKFNYHLTLYIRTRGVESSVERVKEMHDTLVATIFIRFNKEEKVWSIDKVKNF